MTTTYTLTERHKGEQPRHGYTTTHLGCKQVVQPLLFQVGL